MQHATEQQEQIKHLSSVTSAFLLGGKHHSENKSRCGYFNNINLNLSRHTQKNIYTFQKNA